MTRHCKPGEIGIEVGDQQNCNPDFKPMSKTLRGFWSWGNVTHGTMAKNSCLPRMPDLPGMQVFLNMQTGVGRIVDPLEYKENDAVKLTWREYQPGLEPVPEEICKGLSDTAVASWAYWMVRLVKKGEAKLLDGSAKLPNVEVREGHPFGDLPADPIVAPRNARHDWPITRGDLNVLEGSRSLMQRLALQSQGDA